MKEFLKKSKLISSKDYRDKSNLSDLFFLIDAQKQNLDGHGQFPVSMETDRLSAAMIGISLRKYACAQTRETRVEVILETEQPLFVVGGGGTYRFYPLSAESVTRTRREGCQIKKLIKIRGHFIKVVRDSLIMLCKSGVVLNY